MNLVDQDNFAITLAKLIFGVNQDEALAGGNLTTTLKEGTGVLDHCLPVFLAYQSLLDDFFCRDVLVMTLVSLGCGGDDRLGELLVFAHAFRQFDATQFTTSVLVFTPCATCQIATYDHLHAETLSLQSYGYHRVGSSKLPVGDNVGSGIQEAGCNLV